MFDMFPVSEIQRFLMGLIISTLRSRKDSQEKFLTEVPSYWHKFLLNKVTANIKL